MYLGFPFTDQAPQREIMLQKALSALTVEVGWVKNTDAIKTTIPASSEVVLIFYHTVSRELGGLTLICSSGGRNCMSCLRTATSEQITGCSRSFVWSGWMCLPIGEQGPSRLLGCSEEFCHITGATCPNLCFLNPPCTEFLPFWCISVQGNLSEYSSKATGSFSACLEILRSFILLVYWYNLTLSIVMSDQAG